MKFLVLPSVLAAALAACATASEARWPSLALRAGEVQPLVPRPAASAAAAPATPAASAGADAVLRLDSLERDVDSLARRVETQREATTRAATAAQGLGAETAAGSTAQIEISRGERLAAQARDLRDRLDALAGDLARQASAGRDVGAVISRVGAAIERVEALLAP